MVHKVVDLSLRGVQLLFTVIIMALVGNIIAMAFSGNPSIINYDMFTVVFGMLSLFYLIPAAITEGIGPPIIAIVLDVLNTLFYFVAAVATAAKLGVHSCSNQGYLNSNEITNGSRDDKGSRCRQAQASTAFFFFAFAAFAVSAVFSALSGRGGANTRGMGRPSMRQV